MQPDELSAIKKFINLANWRFAKTMPEIPHEYIVIDDYPKKAEQINTFIAEIEQSGYQGSFYGKEYKYLKINNYKYWLIENIINRSKIK